MAADEYDVGAWLVAKLRPIAGINGVHLDVIPRETNLPAIRFSFQTRVDTGLLAGDPTITKFRALVVGVTEGHRVEAVRPIAKAIHSALQGAGDGDVQGTTMIRHCRRLMPFTMTTNEGGQTFRHGGAIYEITAQGS